MILKSQPFVVCSNILFGNNVDGWIIKLFYVFFRNNEKKLYYNQRLTLFFPFARLICAGKKPRKMYFNSGQQKMLKNISRIRKKNIYFEIQAKFGSDLLSHAAVEREREKMPAQNTKYKVPGRVFS